MVDRSAPFSQGQRSQGATHEEKIEGKKKLIKHKKRKLTEGKSSISEHSELQDFKIFWRRISFTEPPTRRLLVDPPPPPPPNTKYAPSSLFLAFH